MTEAGFGRIRDFIRENCGIFFDDEKRYLLETRVADRVRALSLPDAGAYLRYLRHDPGARSELERLHEAITNNETWFFRSHPQLEAFRGPILKEVVAGRRERGTRRLRIWSAACSTGEEAYTLAILACERLGSELADWTVSILGTDLSRRAIDAARAAVYSAYALREVPEPQRTRYFRPGPDEKRFALVAEIRDRVSFACANLLEDAGFRRFTDLDVIFCRNVLIYFDDAAREKVLANLAGSLRCGGYLVLGPHETRTIHTRSIETGVGRGRAFESVHFPHAVAFRKR